MNKLKFSHDYEKLPLNWDGTQAVLWMVWHVADMKDFTNRFTSLIKQDIKFRGEDGEYELNFKEGIMLIFHHLNSGKLFSTFRRYTPEKFMYYHSKQTETFKLVRT